MSDAVIAKRIPRGIARRLAREAQQRVAECDALPGTDPDLWDKQKRAAEFRMLVIDQQPSEWKGLLNDFPHQAVASVADQTASPDEARRLLEARFGAVL